MGTLGPVSVDSAGPETFTDADLAELYDIENPWNAEGWPHDRTFTGVVWGKDTLDVGCGTGSMLHLEREHGEGNRLVGVDPDPVMLARARLRADLDIEWVQATAAEMAFDGEFDVVTMASNAFQCLVTDDELRASLAAIRRALRPGGRFLFNTRHLAARAWEDWNPANGVEVNLPGGRAIREWHEVERVDGPLVTFSETVARRDGTPLRVSRTTLRFHTPGTLNPFLAGAGFEIVRQSSDYGWEHVPVTDDSREIITLARAQ